MKQTLKILTSLVLSASFMLSSLAAPVMIGTVENAAEGVAEQAQTGMADLAADVVITGTEETLIKEYSFDTDAEGWKFISETWTHDGGTAGGQSYVGGLDGDGDYYIESVIEKKTDTVDGKTKKYGADLRVENRNLNFETDAITKIEVRVKNTTGKSHSLKMYWITENYKIDESRTLSEVYDGSDWAVVTFDMTGLTSDNGWADTLTGIRFQLGTEAMNTYSIDYIKLYGYETTVHEWLPGYNILTGTEKPLTFDDGTYSVSDLKVLDEAENTVMTAKDVASISVVPSPVSEQDGYVVKCDITDLPKGTSKYPKVYFDHKDSSGKYVNKMPDDDRPIYVGYNVLVHNADNLSTTATRYNWIMSTGSVHTGHKYNIPKWYLSTETPVWHETKGVNIPIVGGAIPFLQMSYVSGADFTDEMVKPIFYFDNFMYVPYYKVTYMNGTTKLGTAYVLDDGNGNLLESFDPSLYDDEITMPEGKNAWSLTNGGKATHNVALNNEDVVLYATYERTFTPGINILTKTSEALNFDSSAYAVSGSNIYVGGVKKFSVSGGSASIVASPVVGETENKALKFKVNSIAANGSSYPQLVNFVGTLPDEAGRPVFVGAKLLVGNADNLSTAIDARSMRVGADDYTTNYASGVYEPITTFTPENAPADWFHYGIMDKVSTTKLPRFVMTFKTSAAGTASPELYVDDILMVPYYNVTFMNGDTKIGEAWVLDDGKGNILDSFNPAEQGVELPEGKNIWSLKDGGEAVTQVALEYKDIVLYAGYDEEIQDELCPESYFTSSIRTADPSGIRFRASVTTEQKTQAEEYGFIVTLEKHLGTTAAESLTMESNITKLTGVSYGIDPTTGSSVDKIFEKTNENIFFTAALYGMPDTEDAYRQKIIVRPYLKDKDGNYHYAQPIIRSVLDVATAIRDGGYTVVDEDGKKYVENILSVCKESQN